jgi:hypothetical protein
MMRILGIHGIGNLQAGLPPQQAAELLSQRWRAALRPGLDPNAVVDLRVAYYAHCLAHDEPQGPDSLEHLSPAAAHLVLAWVTALGAPPEVAQGRLMAPVRQAADWIAARYELDRRSVRVLVARFAAEVDRYLNLPDCREAAQAVVAAQLNEYSPRVVIAHSLGSVVTYEALFDRPRPPIDLLITVGSPLGMPGVIFEKLRPAPADGLGVKPPGATRWVNIADPGDFVAVPRRLRRLFRGITSDLEASIGLLQFHKATAYLASPAVSGLLAAYLDPTSGTTCGN